MHLFKHIFSMFINHSLIDLGFCMFLITVTEKVPVYIIQSKKYS